jgi:hypothetical protein
VKLKYDEGLLNARMSPAPELEPQRSLKRLTWQYENCLACVWFSPSDPINADILERGKCIHPKLKEFNLIVSGRDWCNLFVEVRQKRIDALQEKAMKQEESH